MLGGDRVAYGTRACADLGRGGREEAAAGKDTALDEVATIGTVATT